MVFSSLTFLWVFLPVVLIVYFLSKEKFYNIILVAASLVFYAWGEPVYILLMLASIIINFFAGLSLGGGTPQRKRIFLALAIIINLSLLGYYKYADFLLANVNYIFQINIPMPRVTLPIGISFYTFHSISYLVDIYRGQNAPQKNIIKMGLYISIFPALIAGPIIKYHDIKRQLDFRRTSLNKFNAGVYRFIAGLGKKVLIANVAAKTADAVFALSPSQYGMATAWIGILAYTLQIYFDFSGYSDMAIGLGKMFGFNIKENFDYPYISQSIKEFWRRWHISLSTWFKEYLYIPLGGNRQGAARTYINLLIVFFATGLWHGASWNFVVWGLFHGTFLVIERVVSVESILRFRFMRNAYVLFVVITGWVFFRSDTLLQAFQFLGKMFSFKSGSEGLFYLSSELIIILSVGFLAGGFFQLANTSFLKNRFYRKFLLAARPVFLCAVFFLCILYIANNTYSPFIYFRF
ncbi:MAG: hypothetical protein LBI01_06060 [Elusimicrobium sp.]|jgi:alginate O-acetyltransferase complex protein AlgI|nr:hypothetical protein [Elusimicrobium sp.]